MGGDGVWPPFTLLLVWIKSKPDLKGGGDGLSDAVDKVSLALYRSVEIAPGKCWYSSLTQWFRSYVTKGLQTTWTRD